MFQKIGLVVLLMPLLASAGQPARGTIPPDPNCPPLSSVTVDTAKQPRLVQQRWIVPLIVSDYNGQQWVGNASCDNQNIQSPQVASTRIQNLLKEGRDLTGKKVILQSSPGTQYVCGWNNGTIDDAGDVIAACTETEAALCGAPVNAVKKLEASK